MDVTKKFRCWVLLLFVGLLMKASVVLAGIKNSPHDIIAWFNHTQAMGVAGTCAYCHVPHSSKGDRLFPKQTSADTAVNIFGDVGAICAKCHVQDYVGTKALVNDEIFKTLGKSKTSTDMDSHPTVRTGWDGSSGQPNTLQNTELDSAAISAAVPWPWLDSWAGYKQGSAKGNSVKDIKCTSCHNPHNWNTEAYGPNGQRKFLRAPIYDSAATNGLNNFCVYCHKERQESARSNSKGTHPVSLGSGSVKLETTAAKPGLYRDDFAGGYKLFKSFCDSSTLSSGNRDGKAIWDSSGEAAFLGARLAPGNQIICQSCHMPHGVMHSDDDVYNDAGAVGTDTAELNVGPLLAINNANSLLNSSKPNRAPDIDDYPIKSESVYCLPAGYEQNLLCEWCHGMTPDLESAAESTAAFAHPVNLYPDSTNDNMPSESDHGFGTLWIKYPPAGWRKYRESSGIRGAGNADHEANSALPAGNNRGTGNYLVCLSCHEAHNADTTRQDGANSYLLKNGSGIDPAGKSFCDGCHKDMAMGTCDVADEYFTTWTTHPSGTTARLTNKDGGTLPNRASLRVFDTTHTRGGYVSCWTCHKGHKGVEKPVLADYQEPFSQICVNCHCEGGIVAPPSTTAPGDSKDAKWKYGGSGEAGATNANPSKYYREGAWPNWWEDKAGKRTPVISAKFAVGDVMRGGSHYIGQFTGTRPLLTSSDNCGWLGERDSSLVTGGDIKMNILNHSRGSVTGATGEAEDKWLDTSSPLFVDTAWNVWTGGSGSSQASHAGDLGGGTRNVIICQSCHAVHNSVSGVADDSSVSRLLLASNYDSYMCKRCHIPEVKTAACTTNTHPMSADASGGNFPYNTAVGRTGGLGVSLTSDAFAYVTVYAPANYPGGNLNCDGCHSVHNADSKMGAMCVEGDSTVCGSSGSGVSKIESTYLNKVPVKTERNDKPTCDLCHKQGTASE